MKLQSWEILQAIEAGNTSLAVQIFLQYFGLPAFARKPILNHPKNPPDAPCIIAYSGGPRHYMWSSKYGFTSQGVPAVNTLESDGSIHTIAVWTGKDQFFNEIKVLYNNGSD